MSPQRQQNINDIAAGESPAAPKFPREIRRKPEPTEHNALLQQPARRKTERNFVAEAIEYLELGLLSVDEFLDALECPERSAILHRRFNCDIDITGSLWEAFDVFSASNARAFALFQVMARISERVTTQEIPQLWETLVVIGVGDLPTCDTDRVLEWLKGHGRAQLARELREIIDSS